MLRKEGGVGKSSHQRGPPVAGEILQKSSKQEGGKQTLQQAVKEESLSGRFW